MGEKDVLEAHNTRYKVWGKDKWLAPSSFQEEINVSKCRKLEGHGPADSLQHTVKNNWFTERWIYGTTCNRHQSGIAQIH